MNLGQFTAFADLAGLLLGFIFTLMIFSYLLGDNPFFRLALHIFVGVASAFALVVVAYNIFWNQLLLPLIEAPMQSMLLLVPLFLGIWLVLTKGFSLRLSRLGNPVMAFLVGVGAAAAIGGSVLGTLFPQMGASAGVFNMQAARLAGINPALYVFNGLVLLVGTISTLLYFHFSARPRPDGPPQRNALLERVAQVGQGFIAVTFGVLFAGVYAAALAALIERLDFVVDRIFLETILPLFTAF
jgi:hypothetical protein